MHPTHTCSMCQGEVCKTAELFYTCNGKSTWVHARFHTDIANAAFMSLPGITLT